MALYKATTIYIVTVFFFALKFMAADLKSVNNTAKFYCADYRLCACGFASSLQVDFKLAILLLHKIEKDFL